MNSSLCRWRSTSQVQRPNDRNDGRTSDVLEVLNERIHGSLVLMSGIIRRMLVELRVGVRVRRLKRRKGVRSVGADGSNQRLPVGVEG